MCYHQLRMQWGWLWWRRITNFLIIHKWSRKIEFCWAISLIVFKIVFVKARILFFSNFVSNFNSILSQCFTVTSIGGPSESTDKRSIRRCATNKAVAVVSDSSVIEGFRWTLTTCANVPTLHNSFLSVIISGTSAVLSKHNDKN